MTNTPLIVTYKSREVMDNKCSVPQISYSSLKQGELTPRLEWPWYHGKTKLSYTALGECDGFTVTNHKTNNMDKNEVHCAEATLGFEPTSVGNKVHPFATRTLIIHTVVIE